MSALDDDQYAEYQAGWWRRSVFTQFGSGSPARRNTKRDDANSRFLRSGVASARLIAEQGHAVPGTVGGNVAESVKRKVGLPLASEGQGSSQLADGVGGLGTAGSAALPLPIFGTVLGGKSVIGSIAGNLPGSRHDLRAARRGRKARAYSAYAPPTESPQLSCSSHSLSQLGRRRAPRPRPARRHCPGQPAGPADPACCCPARPVVRVVMPATAARPHRTELLLCGHHYRVSRQALAAARAVVTEIPGMPWNPSAALLPGLRGTRACIS